MSKPSPFPMLTLPDIVGKTGLLTDGDWVESKDQDPSGTVRLTQLADVGDGEFRDRSDRWMNDEQASQLNVTMLKAGDVLIARMPDPLGRACVCPALPTRAVTVVDVCIVRAPGHNPKWLMYALNAPQMRSEVAKLQGGSTRKRISKGNLSTIPIPVPPRADQDRFVGVIETHFSRLDAAVASLTRAKANLKRARASVLKAAVEGRLVPTEAALARAEGREHEPASVLLGRVLVERKAAWAASGARGKYAEAVKPETAGLPELPEGWVWTSVDALAGNGGKGLCDGPFGSNLKSAHYVESGPRVVRLQNIGDGVFRDEYAHITVEHFRSLSKHAVKGGDLVIASLGETLPRACIVPDWLGSAIVKADCVRFSATLSVSGQYLNAALNAQPIRDRTTAKVHGIGRPRLGLAGIREIELPLPPLAEQRRIVAEVDRRLSVFDALVASVEANLARCARLRQAILKRAFEGRLVLAEDDTR